MKSSYEKNVDVSKIKHGDVVKYEDSGIQSGIVIKAIVKGDRYSRFHIHHTNDNDRVKILLGHKIIGHNPQNKRLRKGVIMLEIKGDIDG